RLATGAGNNRVLKTTGITVSSGQLDVTDNKLIVSGAASASTFSGGSYGGVAGLVAAGRNGGTWDGTGIITSQSNAASPSVLTGLAVASADELGRVGQTFAGKVLVTGDEMVMYTYGGDANLDGRVNGDDYFRIDSNINTATA